MSSDELTGLIERLARARGIGDAYYTYKGELRHFSLATKAAILRAMHCRLDDAAALQQQIHESEAAHPVGLLGDVVVLRNGARAARINTPAIEQNALLKWTVKFEGGGGTRSGEVRVWDLPEHGSHQEDGKWYVLRDLPLPDDLPLGYHRLEADLEFAGRESCPLIVAPDKCFEPQGLAANARIWGVAVQLYALRSENNWGIGDFSDLAELLRLAHYKHNNPVVVPGFDLKKCASGGIPNSERSSVPPMLQASGKRRLASKEIKTRKKDFYEMEFEVHYQCLCCIPYGAFGSSPGNTQYQDRWNRNHSGTIHQRNARRASRPRGEGQRPYRHGGPELRR